MSCITDDFTYREVEDVGADTSLSTGEIIAVMFGIVILLGLFAGAVYVVIRPPSWLKPFLVPQASDLNYGEATPYQSEETPSSLENPVYELERQESEDTSNSQHEMPE